jgi:hypothetical protein
LYNTYSCQTQEEEPENANGLGLFVRDQNENPSLTGRTTISSEWSSRILFSGSSRLMDKSTIETTNWLLFKNSLIWP